MNPEVLPVVRAKRRTSAIPVEMTRLNPFFIMTRQEMRDRPIIKLQVQNSWGIMTLQGERLSVFDESVFLGVLNLVGRQSSTEVVTTGYELLNIARLTKGGENYQTLWESLKRLGRTQISIEKWDPDKTKSPRKPIQGFFNTLIQRGEYERTGKRTAITLKVDSYFLQTCAGSLVTFIDIDFRHTLDGDIAKALYRFYQSQPKTYRINVDSLCAAINLEKRGLVKKLNQRLREAHEELKKKGYLKIWKFEKKVFSIAR